MPPRTLRNAHAAAGRTPANSNEPSGTYTCDAENIGDIQPMSSASRHVYVETAEPPRSANSNVERHLKVARGIVVSTDLPDRLPILPEEIALIRTYLGALIAKTNANDN